MTRFTKKHTKYLNFKEEKKDILKIIIHHSKALETKHPKYDHIYTIIHIRVNISKLHEWYCANVQGCKQQIHNTYMKI